MPAANPQHHRDEQAGPQVQEQADDHRDAEAGHQQAAVQAERFLDVLFRQVGGHRADQDETHQDQLADAQPRQEIQTFLLLFRHLPYPLSPAPSAF